MNERERENNLLLNNYLNKRFFHNMDFDMHKMELIIRPDCNQKCSYCYLVQQGKEIYPHRINNKELLSNIEQILNYILIEKNIYISSWDLFAGDLFYDNIYFDILDIFYKYYSNLFKDNKLNNKVHIMTPCNLSFLKEPEKEKRFEEYFNKFSQINCVLLLSYSTDGFYAQDIREHTKLDQEWFDKTLSFCAKYGFGLHPMISYESIDNYIENYDWWIENVNKHFDIDTIWSPMFLAVRNDGWTDDSINKYIKLIEHIVNFRLELFDGNIYNFTKHLTQNQKERGLLRAPAADIISLKHYIDEKNAINCCSSNTLVINCQNLEIVPCHRLAHPHLSAGKFISENNKIIGVKALNNLSGYINIIENNRFFRPTCVTCEIKGFCSQGCMGAQYEATGEIFATIPSVCALFKAHWDFLLNKYKELGVLDLILDPAFDNYSPSLAEKINNYFIFKENQKNETIRKN